VRARARLGRPGGCILSIAGAQDRFPGGVTALYFELTRSSKDTPLKGLIDFRTM
jgi:hypothetical protein